MSFLSYSFFLFLFIVFVSYYIVPIKKQWIVLLIFSILFYVFESNILYILISGISTYLISLWIEKESSSKKNQKKLIIGISLNMILLLTLKYNLLKEMIGRSILIPLGISYYTLSSISYLVDIYQKKIKTNGFFRFFLSISFFPTLILGPINRYQKIEKTLFQNHSFHLQNVIDGSLRILYGIFKKLVIADSIYLIVNFIVTEKIGGIIPIFGLLLYGIQIYADFSSGMDIVLGFSKMLQIDLEENFNTPYFSKSLSEFWNRWHMTLTNWFKDYVYIPLGGNRTTTWKRNQNIFLVFLLSGLWHGFTWNFLLWGMLNGIFLILEKTCSYHPKSNLAILKNYIVVCLLWIFFMYPDLESIISIFHASKFTLPFFEIMSPAAYLVLIISIFFFIFVEYQKYQKKTFSFLGRNRDYILLLLFIFTIILFGNYGFSFNKAEFIYSRF